METSVANHQLKIKLLLQKFLETKKQPQIDQHLQNLLTHLWQQEKTEVESTLITLPTFTEWIKEAVGKWSATGVSPPPTIASFTLSLAGLLSKNEERFCGLNNNNFYIKLVNVLKARQSGAAPPVKLSYIKLLSSFLEHTSGIEWMMACNFWEDAFQLTLSNQNDDIVKDGTHFMSKILEKTVDLDENFCSNIVKRVMLPLGENIYRSIKASNDMMDVTQDVASHYLRPTLRLIGNILEYFLEGIHFGHKDFQVVLVFLKSFHLEERISDFMIIAQTKCLVFDLAKIMFIMQFLELYVKVATNSISATNINASIRRIKNNYMMNISKAETFEDVLEFSTFGQLYWNLMDSKIPLVATKKSTTIPFSNQLAIMQTLPYFCVALKYFCDQGLEELWSEHFRDLFIDKLFKNLCLDAIRSCYQWRDKIISRQDLFKVCTLCGSRIKESLKYVSKDVAVMLAQTFTYNLKDLVDNCKESPTKLDIFSNELYQLSQSFDILTLLIEEFEITWKDSLEVMDVLALSLDFLTLRRWPPNVVVQVFKLINVAIAKYMAPNMALLLDNTTDSAIVLLGPLLFSKLYDDSAEVKSAALDVICTIARISSSKVESTLITLTVFTEWIKKAVATWSTTGVIPMTNIVSLTLNLASMLSKKEETFCELNSNNFFIKLVNISRARHVEVAYIELLLAFLEHHSGIEFMIALNLWEDVYLMSLSAQNDQIKQRSTQFMAKFLEKSIDHDEKFCIAVVKQIMLPLGDNIDKCLKAATDVNVAEKVASQNLGPTLKLIGNILDYFLEGILFDQKDFRVVLMFFTNFRLKERISEFMRIAQTKCLVFDFGKIMFIMQFLELFVKVSTNSLNAADIQASVDQIRSNFLLSLSKESFDDVVEFCHFGQMFWTLMDQKIPQVKNKNPVPFGGQLMVLQLVPNFVLIISYFSTRSQMLEVLREEIRDEFMYKITKILSYDVLRTCFTWRQYLVSHLCNLHELATRSLKHVKDSRKYFSKEKAVMVFQALIHNSKDFIEAIKKSPEKINNISEDLCYFSKVFEIVIFLIQEFHLTWKDSYETVDVIVVCFDFLTLPKWSTDVLIQGLKLINTAVAKYMSPNMALLVDRTEDSTIDMFGPLLYAKLYDEEPKVKKEALEVICTMSCMSSCSKLTFICLSFCLLPIDTSIFTQN